MKRNLVILLLLSLLCGCANQNPDYTLDAPDPAASTASSEPAPSWNGVWRDYATYPVEKPSGSVLGNKYYYTTSKLVSYYDFELERMIVPCSQPNCTHSEETCSAYLSGAQSVLYQRNGDVAYAIASDGGDGGRASLLRLNPVTGEAELLLQEPVPEAENIALNGTYLVLEATTERLLLIARQGDWKEEPVSRAESIAQGHTAEEYPAYLDSIFPETVHYSLDRQTGEETRIFAAVCTYR